MPIPPAKYINGREGAFILGTLIPYLDALEERVAFLEKTQVTYAKVPSTEVLTEPPPKVLTPPSTTKLTVKKLIKASSK